MQRAGKVQQDWAPRSGHGHPYPSPAPPFLTHAKQEAALGPVHFLLLLPGRLLAQGATRLLPALLSGHSSKTTSLTVLSKIASSSHTHYPLCPFPALFPFVLITTCHSLGLLVHCLSPTPLPLHCNASSMRAGDLSIPITPVSPVPSIGPGTLKALSKYFQNIGTNALQSTRLESQSAPDFILQITVLQPQPLGAPPTVHNLPSPRTESLHDTLQQGPQSSSPPAQWDFSPLSPSAKWLWVRRCINSTPCCSQEERAWDG